MTEGEELLPCPFCGGNPSMMLNAAEGWHVRYVKCDDCWGQAREFVYRQPELAQWQAIDVWNTRTPTATPSDEVVEKVARALFEDSEYSSIRWETATDALKEDFRKPARAAVAALSAIEGEKK